MSRIVNLLCDDSACVFCGFHSGAQYRIDGLNHKMGDSNLRVEFVLRNRYDHR
jgi:hypothetical protein